MEDKRSKNVVIIALCLALIFMGVGFAALSQNLTINAVGTVSGKSAWDVHYASFAQSDLGGNAENTSEKEGDNFKYLDNANTTATVAFKLTAPGDYIEFKGTIENFGSIDAKLATYTSSFDADNEYITKRITIGGQEITTDESNNVTAPSINLVKAGAGSSSTEVVVRYTLNNLTELPANEVEVKDNIVFGFVQS